MINIDSQQGRIGELWWINADPATPIHARDVFPGLGFQLIRWGTFGYGRDIRVALEPISD